MEIERRNPDPEDITRNLPLNPFAKPIGRGGILGMIRKALFLNRPNQPEIIPKPHNKVHRQQGDILNRLRTVVAIAATFIPSSDATEHRPLREIFGKATKGIRALLNPGKRDVEQESELQPEPLVEKEEIKIYEEIIEELIKISEVRDLTEEELERFRNAVDGIEKLTN